MIIEESEGDGSGNEIGYNFPDMWIYDNESDTIQFIIKFIKEHKIDLCEYFEESSATELENRYEMYVEELSDQKKNKINVKYNMMMKEVEKMSYVEAARLVIQNGCLVIGGGDCYDITLKVLKIKPNQGYIGEDWGPDKGAITKEGPKPAIIFNEDEIWDQFM